MGVGAAPANEPMFRIRPFFLVTLPKKKRRARCRTRVCVSTGRNKMKIKRGAPGDHGGRDEACDSQRGGHVDVDNGGQLLRGRVDKVGGELVGHADVVYCAQNTHTKRQNDIYKTDFFFSCKNWDAPSTPTSISLSSSRSASHLGSSVDAKSMTNVLVCTPPPHSLTIYI